MSALRLGVAGLGRSFGRLLPALAAHPGVELVAAADARPEARARFVRTFAGTPYRDVERLCADPAVEAVYVATPPALHPEHVRLAVAAGKHVLVATPMAPTLEACQAMVDAARAAGVWLLVAGPGADTPYRHARALIEAGGLGAVRMITALDFTDALYAPHRPGELDTARGAGAVFAQALHQVDAVRLLGGGRVRGLRASTGRWDPARPTEAAYAAWLTFEDGAVASLACSGYGRFDSDALPGGPGEPDGARPYGAARARLRGLGAAEEAALVDPGGTRPPPDHAGFLLVACERADLRPGPQGVMVYGEDASRLDLLPPSAIPGGEVLDELVAAIRQGTAPARSGAWGLGTMEVCLGILRAGAEGGEVAMRHQAGLG